MRSPAFLVIAFGLLVAGCTHRPPTSVPAGPVALDALLGFADPARCKPTPGHARFLADLVAPDGKGGFKAGKVDVPPALARAFAPISVRRDADYWVIGLAVSGTLYGLPLGRIDHALPVGGDPGDVTYRFDAPLAATAATLRTRGFPVKAGNSVPLAGTDLTMTLVADPKNAKASLFGCGHE
jgi:hypothetical protein